MVVDASKLAFSADFRYERIALKTSKTFSLSAFGVTTVSIQHNLGYIPYIKSYYTYGDGKYYELYAGNRSYAIAGNGGQIDTAYADATNYYVEVSENNGSPISGSIYCRIYAEPQS